MKLIPFDLELFKQGYIAVDRFQRTYKFIAYNKELILFQQLIIMDTTYNVVTFRYKTGRAQQDDMDTTYDLVGLIEQTETRWLNIYPTGATSTQLYTSKEEANQGAVASRIACIPIEIPSHLFEKE